MHLTESLPPELRPASLSGRMIRRTAAAVSPRAGHSPLTPSELRRIVADLIG